MNNTDIYNRSATGSTNFMSAQQLCALALIDVRDTMQKQAESVQDFSLLNLNHVVNGQDLENMYDPIAKSLCEFTWYTDVKGVSKICSIKQVVTTQAPFLSRTLVEGLCNIFDITTAEINRYGIYGALLRCRDVDPSSANIRECITKSSYLMGRQASGDIMHLLQLIDGEYPSYGYVYQKVFNYTSELEGLRELCLIGDFHLEANVYAALLACNDYSDFLSAAQLTPEELLNILLSQKTSEASDHTVLDALNYQLAKKFTVNINGHYSSLYNYKLLNDATDEFRTTIFKDQHNNFVSLLHNAAEQSVFQGILQKALGVVVSGSGSVGDLAAFLGQGYDSSYDSAKELITTLSAYGSNYNAGVANAMASLYGSMKNAKVHSANVIDWGDVEVPVLDTGIGSVIIGVAMSAAQIAGSIMLFAGGLLSKIAGGVLFAVSSAYQAISTAVAQAAGTFPEFVSSTSDRLFGYPIFQKSNLLIRNPSPEVVQLLERDGAVKIFYPWMVVFIYNYDKSTSKGTVKIFLNVTSRSLVSDTVGIGGLYRIEYMDSSLFNNGSVHVSSYTMPNDHTFVLNNLSRSVQGGWNAVKAALDPNDSRARLVAVGSDPSEYKVKATTTLDSRDASSYFGLWNLIMMNMSLAHFTFDKSGANGYSSGSIEFFAPGLIKTASGGYLHGPTSSERVLNILNNENKEKYYLECLCYFLGVHATSHPAYGDDPFHVYAPYGCNIFTHTWSDFPAYVINDFCPWLAGHINRKLSGALDMSIFADTGGVVLPWAGVDTYYAVTPPKKTVQSLIFAAVLTIVVVAATIITFSVVKTLISRKLQPSWMARIDALSKDREALGELEVNTPEDARAKTLITKEYLKRVRHFNLISKLLGMGTYNPMADWYEGSGTIGGTWSDATDDQGVMDEAVSTTSYSSDASIKTIAYDPESDSYVSISDVIGEVDVVKKLIKP